jgi:hypothetical protein
LVTREKKKAGEKPGEDYLKNRLAFKGREKIFKDSYRLEAGNYQSPISSKVISTSWRRDRRASSNTGGGFKVAKRQGKQKPLEVKISAGTLHWIQVMVLPQRIFILTEA